MVSVIVQPESLWIFISVVTEKRYYGSGYLGVQLLIVLASIVCVFSVFTD